MSAERGWIGDPPPERERTPPSHAYKWYKMMGAAELLPETPRTKEARPPGWIRCLRTSRRDLAGAMDVKTMQYHQVRILCALRDKILEEMLETDKTLTRQTWSWVMR